MRYLHTFLLLFLAANIIYSQRKPVKFTDITRRAGLDFRYTFGDLSYVNILESSGSGITIFDYNNDGLMDLYMLNGTYIAGISDPAGRTFANTPDKLYRNNGNGTFTEVSGAAGLDDVHWSMAAAATDYDNDGDQDLFLLNYGPNVFYRNNGNGTFTDITKETGLAGPEKLNGFTKWSIGAVFFDHNQDGKIDVMVGNFLAFDPAYDSPVTPGKMPHPSEYKGQASMFYEQQSDGSFIDATKKYGLWYPDSKCMGLTVLDYDEDGDLDIFQANDHQLNYLFRNDKGYFTEVGVESGVAANTQGIGSGSMHGSPGDADGDGLIDLPVSDLEYGALYRNRGNGLFEDIVEKSGVSGYLAGKGGWATQFLDFDNDGDQDIVSANGTAEELILQLPLLLENDGKGRFSNSGEKYNKYFATKRSGRGLAVWDFDNDGDNDIVISHVDMQATAVLLRNDGGNKNNWIGLTLRGKNGQASANGAKVEITAGGRKQVLINQWGTCYLSNNDPRIRAGLGGEKVIEVLSITWPDGTKEVLKGIEAGRYITIVQGIGIVTK